VPFDVNPAYPDASCYPVANLLKVVSRLGGRSAIVVLDTAFNGDAAPSEPV
jgi:histidinol-phosphate/aromatic aminotransferase/cobyric acid decarboxylase-like protein